MNLTSTALAILSRPKAERMAWIERWPSDLQEPIKEHIRLIHGGWTPDAVKDDQERHSAFRVYLEGKRQPVSMICSERATEEEALEVAGQVFLRNTVQKVEVVRRTVDTSE